MLPKTDEPDGEVNDDRDRYEKRYPGHQSSILYDFNLFRMVLTSRPSCRISARSLRQSGGTQMAAELAAAYGRLGDVVGELESQPRAIPYYLQERDLYRRLLRERRGEPVYRRELGRCCRALATAQYYAGEHAMAEEGFREARALQEELVRDRPDPNGGPPTRAVGRADKATYTAATGDVELRGTPRVQEGLNMHVATSPDTVMIINQNSQLTTHGPSRTEIRQQPNEQKKGGATPSQTSPASQISPAPPLPKP